MPATIARFTSGGRPVSVEVFVPPGTGRHPAVLILHGTFGLLPEYRADFVSFAEAVVAGGMVAVLPHYFERTGTEAGLPATMTMLTELPAWRAACGDALVFARGHPAVDAGRLGALGFSLGGHIVLGLGMSPPAGTSLKCVVDFFGPTISPPVPGNRTALPPVLIHHGTDDRVVPIENSLQLVKELKAVGRTEGVGYEFLTYPGQDHGFTGADQSKSRVRTIEFLEGIL